ncbi:hypothetical protein MauCBS54593_001576 [Microsporum audouinii]
MARLDELPDDILLCIFDQAWSAWETWTFMDGVPAYLSALIVFRPGGGYRFDLLKANKAFLWLKERFEAVVERWMCSQIKPFDDDTGDNETWLSAMLPRPAMRLFMKRLGDAESMVDGKQRYAGGKEFLESVNQVTEYLVGETRRNGNDPSTLRDSYQKSLCTLAAAQLCSGNQEPFFDTFLEEDGRVEQRAKEMVTDACSVGGVIAVFEDNPPLLAHLLREGPFDINIDHKFFGNPILVAAHMGRLECMKILLEQPGREFLCNGADLNALHLAARRGDVPMIKLLLDCNDGTLNQFEQETTPLGLAAGKGHLSSVELLLHGLDPPPTSEIIDMAITNAASSGHEEVVKLLWEYSSIPSLVGQGYGMGFLNIDGEDSDSEYSGDAVAEDAVAEDAVAEDEVAEDWYTENEGAEDISELEGYGFEDMLGIAVETDMALFAAKNGHENIIKLIIDSDEFGPKAKKTIAQSCFQAALQFDSTSVAQLLLDRFEDLANKGYTGNTRPLAVAAACTATEVMKLLLKRNDINVNHVNAAGATAICYSMRPPMELVCKVTDELETLELLAARDDVDVNWADRNGDTPLIGAVIAGDPRMVKALMGRKELNVNARNRFDETALSRSVLLGNTAIVKILLGRDDIEADKKNKLGQTPLLMAAISDYIDILKLFLNRSDVNIEARDAKGRTALWLAAKQGNIQTVKCLMYHCAKIGVDLNQRDDEGISPLEVAKLGESEEYPEVIQILSQNVEKNITGNSYHTNITQTFQSDDHCCVACSLIHPEAHGVYSGLIPGFAFV